MVGKGGESGNNAASGAGNAKVSFRNRIRRGNSSQQELQVDAAAAEAEHTARKSSKSQREVATPKTDASTPSPTSPNGHQKTPSGVRGRKDVRSPGVKKTPQQASTKAAAVPPESSGNDDDAAAPVPDFITQTDKFGNASTPRSPDAIQSARRLHPSGPVPHIHVNPDTGAVENDQDGTAPKQDGVDVDACDTLLESLRMMCCCLIPDENQQPQAKNSAEHTSEGEKERHANDTESQYSTRGPNAGMLVASDSIAAQNEDENRVRLLPKHHPDDMGKKCLVLDLDETLVHSSFRAVPGADFVIPVQIEDVVHFVYVAKRPGVDEFLIEMAKHYEIVVYTASLNKYADPLLDLLDPNRVIRTRLFRESCVYYEGNYVKDLSLLDRDLTQAIIVDNSPSSYIFHPENAIDCSSFIDDPADRELDQIGAFLAGIKDIDDVRHVCNLWREWPNIDLPPPINGHGGSNGVSQHR